MNPVEKMLRATLILSLFVAALLLLLSAAHAAPASQVASCLNASVTTDPSATVCISNVRVPFDGTSVENEFFVSWRTPDAVSGRVKLTSGETFDDVRGSGYAGRTHYVRVNNLAPRTTHTFDLVSGDQTYTNKNAHWSVRLGEAVQPGTPYVIIGHVNNPDGSGADKALVFAVVRDRDAQGTKGPSALLSAVISVEDGGDLFNINLDEARTPDLANKFIFDPNQDRVLVSVIGEEGTVGKQFRIFQLHPPQAPPSLTLSPSGTGDVTTATPTLLPPSETPTFSPTPTETATLTPTVTEPVPTRSKPTKPLPTETSDLSPTPETTATSTPENVTQVAQSAGQVPSERTRVYGGIPTIQPPPPNSSNMLLYIGLAVVLFIGAVLLGLAAFFVGRR